MRKWTLAASAAALLAGLSLASAEDATGTISAIDTEAMTVTLDNGLTLFLQEKHDAPVTSFWTWYRVGSRNELPGRTGRVGRGDDARAPEWLEKAGDIGRELSWEADDLALQNIQARARGPSVWMLANLRNAYRAAEKDDSIKTIVFESIGGKHFVSGADLPALQAGVALSHS